MVCDKDVCERWCVTKLCVKDGVCQSGGGGRGGGIQNQKSEPHTKMWGITLFRSIPPPDSVIVSDISSRIYRIYIYIYMYLCFLNK